ncbi:PspC domain-containing protein [Streptococcus downei]|uniref:PspC domain-containing protein n=1 Tax=Streptococcus downei MFe28 TaxID=764290 RepID=A0A380JD30_STRDO|nr:PspC domain-containing protein [Streptococcus downei]SUN35892.1 PspC domain-containing protein [Streptococcus downei MFe28]
MSVLYKKRQGRFLAGVLAGLADKFGWDLTLARILYGIFTYFSFGFGVFLYILLAVLLPYKEDEERDKYGTGPRRRKDAEVIDDDKWFW